VWLNYNLTFRNFNVGVENLQPLLQAAAKGNLIYQVVLGENKRHKDFSG